MANAPAKPASLIGDALVEEGVLHPEQLARALRIQAHLEQPRQLGDILIELGFATRQQISAIVSKCGSQMKLGDLLLSQGLITEEALQSALRQQKAEPRPLGRILVDMGLINERILLRNLASQSQVAYIEPNFAMVDTDLLAKTSPDYLARFGFVPILRQENGQVLVVVSDLADNAAAQAIEELYREGHALALGPQDNIRACIDDFRRYRVQPKDAGEADLSGSDRTVVKLVEHIFAQAIDEGASDIHIEPMADRIRLRFRIDGVLVFRTDLPKDLHNRLVSRIKILAECNITEHQRHQGGRINVVNKGQEYDLRLSVYVTVHGQCIVLRVLNKQVGLVSLSDLGMTPSMLERFRLDVLELPTGVVLITGPTGSGKTTTLYSSLDYCNQIDRKIITVEDPVEYVIDGLIQCSVFNKVGRTFEESLREIVRQDPDIIVLGEIRDKTTAETAIEAALTGHKVYSTFHTEDTIGGLVRLLNMEIDAFLISSTIISVLAQRLLRRICPDCAIPYTPTSAEVRRVGLDFDEVRKFEFTKGQGCTHCSFTGYRGRVGAYELLVVNDDVKSGILDRRPAHEIRRISIERTGLISMREDAVGKVLRGLTTFEEALRHTPQTFAMRSVSQIVGMTK